MPDHARSGGTALRVTTALLALLPATVTATATASEPLPALPPLPSGMPVIDAPPLPSVPAAPAVPALPALPPVALPPVAAAAASCPGARRRSSPRRRRAAVRCLVNHARHRAGLRGFRHNGSLARAAHRHAHDMARLRYFAHQRAGGPAVTSRARRAGWRGRSLGEAIAYGCRSSSTPLRIVRSWLASPPHAAILLSRSFGQAGIGSARPPLSCRGATYVLVAGRR